MRRHHLVVLWLAGLVVGRVTAQSSGDGWLEAKDDANGTEYEVDGSGMPEEDECWDRDAFHPEVRFPDTTVWSHCPQKSPTTWREKDFDIGIECNDDGATFSFDLSKMNSVNWMEGVQADVMVKDGILITKTIHISNYETKNEERLDDFCPGTTYSVCLVFNHGTSESNTICKVSCLEKVWNMNSRCIELNSKEIGGYCALGLLDRFQRVTINFTQSQTAL